MNNKYNGDCMEFSNEELKKYIYERFCGDTNLRIKCLSEEGDEISITSAEEIDTIAFDEEENVSIMFMGWQTSIFAYNTELMFIDEDCKGTYTSSDVYHNAVYEEKMREMTHMQMLQMFAEIILCFIDAINVNMVQSDVPENKNYKRYNYYKPYMFTINVENKHEIRKTKIYENITINY